MTLNSIQSSLTSNQSGTAPGKEKKQQKNKQRSALFKQFDYSQTTSARVQTHIHDGRVGAHFENDSVVNFLSFPSAVSQQE